MKGKSIVLNLGFSHPIDFSLPEGLLTDDLEALINDKSIDIAIELVGKHSDRNL